MLDLKQFGFEGSRHPQGLIVEPSIHANFAIYHEARPAQKIHCNTEAEFFQAALTLAENHGRVAGSDAFFERLRNLLRGD